MIYKGRKIKTIADRCHVCGEFMYGRNEWRIHLHVDHPKSAYNKDGTIKSDLELKAIDWNPPELTERQRAILGTVMAKEHPEGCPCLPCSQERRGLRPKA